MRSLTGLGIDEQGFTLSRGVGCCHLDIVLGPAEQVGKDHWVHAFLDCRLQNWTWGWVRHNSIKDVYDKKTMAEQWLNQNTLANASLARHVFRLRDRCHCESEELLVRLSDPKNCDHVVIAVNTLWHFSSSRFHLCCNQWDKVSSTDVLNVKQQ